MSCTSDETRIDWKDILNKLRQNPFTPEQANSGVLRSYDMSNDFTLPRKYRRMLKRKK